MRNIVLKHGLVLISLCLTLGVLELLVRLAGYQPFKEPELSVTGYYWICDRNLGFRNRGNGSYYYERILSGPRSTTDSLGFRNGFGWMYDNDSPIVLFIGDSTTFCAEVIDEHTAPSEVAKLLHQKFKVRVLNAGVRGYNSLQSKRMLQACLEKFPEIAIVVYVYCDNDYFENLNPEINSAKAPTVRYENGRLKPVEVTEPKVPWGQAFADLELKRELGLRIRVTNYLRSFSALVHQSLGALNKIKGSYHLAAEIEGARKHHAEEALEKLVRQMDGICRANGVTFLTTSFFTGLDLYGNGADYPAICQRAGVRYINLRAYFTDSPFSYLAKRSDGTYDPHYGPKGTKTFAKGVAPTLESILESRETAGGSEHFGIDGPKTYAGSF